MKSSSFAIPSLAVLAFSAGLKAQSPGTQPLPQGNEGDVAHAISYTPSNVQTAIPYAHGILDQQADKSQDTGHGSGQEFDWNPLAEWLKSVPPDVLQKVQDDLGLSSQERKVIKVVLAGPPEGADSGLMDEILERMKHNENFVYFLFVAFAIALGAYWLNDKVQPRLIEIGHTLGGKIATGAAWLAVWAAAIGFLQKPLGIPDYTMHNFFIIYLLLTYTPFINNFFNGGKVKQALKIAGAGSAAYLIGPAATDIYSALDSAIDREHVVPASAVIVVGTAVELITGLNNSYKSEFIKLMLALFAGYATGNYINVDWKTTKTDNAAGITLVFEHKPGGIALIHDFWTGVGVSEDKAQPIPAKATPQGLPAGKKQTKPGSDRPKPTK